VLSIDLLKKKVCERLAIIEIPIRSWGKEHVVLWEEELEIMIIYGVRQTYNRRKRRRKKKRFQIHPTPKS
jgi:hypothetical protein